MIVLTTYDRMPEPPRGHVRGLRVRRALEEAGLDYRVESTPFRDRAPDHRAHQPFRQVPWIEDAARTVFESGAILLHIGEKGGLLPAGARRSIRVDPVALRAAELGGDLLPPLEPRRLRGGDRRSGGESAVGQAADDAAGRARYRV
ncbi:glutathione S-transferase N-terminal domain-containing protein [Wenxinia saemankumensis]|uniref:glutathione S-transferase N-terminal domain-containing protein n=1 Tax=Wenxinia saemankumensis TaxID=1447782 RepID=UPI001BAFB7AB|nr:glutathione S-transferase N-terminal domain-containing protein [Wenxinia saemankumensis]